jgi:hypothetical protein
MWPFTATKHVVYQICIYTLVATIPSIHPWCPYFFIHHGTTNSIPEITRAIPFDYFALTNQYFKITIPLHPSPAWSETSVTFGCALPYLSISCSSLLWLLTFLNFYLEFLGAYCVWLLYKPRTALQRQLFFCIELSYCIELYNERESWHVMPIWIAIK